ncbi:uncharacterized protein ARMOST_13997 [Armillaria ostoyae]|uniref:Uncharacterized protein n=1 Tax=Armillaria ostoyae TaxID=47428 RepID=A0A284RPC5_ARMOS|nr:uncharacterized protein ARMOST_13997 [Armillaria ostoyae]
MPTLSNDHSSTGNELDDWEYIYDDANNTQNLKAMMKMSHPIFRPPPAASPKEDTNADLHRKPHAKRESRSPYLNRYTSA